jgi:hypothetical protein
MWTALIDEKALDADVIGQIVADWRIGTAGSHRIRAGEAARRHGGVVAATIRHGFWIAAWAGLAVTSGHHDWFAGGVDIRCLLGAEHSLARAKE